MHAALVTRFKVQCVTYHTAVIAAERKSDSKLTKASGLSRLSRRYMGCLLWRFRENWPYYNGTALYVYIRISRDADMGRKDFDEIIWMKTHPTGM